MTDVPQIYRDHLAAVTGDDPAAIRAIWEPDGVLEFPYAQSLGSPGRLDGIEAIVDYFSGLGLFEGFTFSGMRAWRIEGAQEYVLEVHGSARVIATRQAYEQDYVVRFGLGEGNRIAWMREFWDPTRL